MSTVSDEKAELEQTNRHLAPIFAKWMHALMECSDEVQEVVRDMVEIIRDPDATDDEKEMVSETLLEALFPTSHNGSLGADLMDLEDEMREQAGGEIISQMNTEELAFGERVKNALIDKQMTQQDLADAIGVGQPAVSMMLNREARPQQRTVQKIADALGMHYDDLWPV